MQPLPAPPIPDGFWLVMASCQGLFCGAFSTLLIVMCVCVCLILARDSYTAKLRNNRKRIKSYID